MSLTPPLARRNLAHGKSARHNEMVVESSESSLFLKRNFFLRCPNPSSSRNLASAVKNRSSYNLAGRRSAEHTSELQSLPARRSSDLREQFVLETELLLALPQSFFVAEPGERGEEQILVQLGGPVFVGIGEGGFVGGLGDTEMNQFAQATAQAV